MGTYGGKVEGCLFRDIAGNGLVAGSFSPAGHETHYPYDPADRRELCTHLQVMNNNRVHANLIHHYAKHMYDVAGIYTLGAQPKSYLTENCVHSIYSPGYAHDPNHWFYLYTDEGSSFITVKDNWTESEKFLQNANGPGNVWENNGPMVSDSIRRNAGLTEKYKYLIKKADR